jgi:cytochrome oxidase assembly protein ShyY1
MTEQLNQTQTLNAESIKGLLLNKNWIIFTALIIVALLVSIRLGVWQYERHEARMESNQLIEQSLSQQSIPLNQLSEIDLNNWQRVSVTGEFDLESQMLVRRRYLQGNLGFWVVAKLNTTDGRIVLVNRGFTPVVAAANQSPEVALPPSGTVQLTGYLHNLDPESFRPNDLPQGQVNAINNAQFGLTENDYQFFIHQIDANSELDNVTPPILGYGSHLAYSLQWFAFGFMIILGWLILTRKEIMEQKNIVT